MVRFCSILSVFSDKFPSGNLMTSLRIKHFLEQKRFTCEIFHPENHDQDQNTLNKSDLIIFIHAYYCSSTILRLNPNIPKILIFGGTDLNVHSKDPQKKEQMLQVFEKCSYIVAFSSEMSKIAAKIWSDINWSEKLHVIPQSIDRALQSKSTINNYIFDQSINNLDSMDMDNRKYVLWLGGIRQVKDPLFAIMAFINYSHLIADDLYLLIIGPIIEKNLGSKVLELAKANEKIVKYIGSCSKLETEFYLSRAFCLVNSSELEGMSLAILEGMNLRCPIVARKIVGNMSIINDGVNGLLFSEQREMMEKLNLLLTNPEMRNKLTSEGSKYIDQNHNPQYEFEMYSKLIDSIVI